MEGGTGRKGTVSHRPLPAPIPLGQQISEFARPQCPEDLPEEGQELWNVAIEELVKLGAAQMIDTPALRLMCEEYATARQAWKMIQDEGITTLGSMGQKVPHPATQVRARALQSFMRIAEQFGLTLLARSRIGLMEVQKRSIEQEMFDSLGPVARKVKRA